jgi:hypothetical protein
MNKFINYSEFMHYLIDDEKSAEKGGEIVKAILEAKSPRLTHIAEAMKGQSESNYKAIHRFIRQTDVKEALLRLYQEEADFVIGDPTEMPRYKAPKTEYVGTLSDGQTPGYWLLVLSTPFRGRAIPFHFITYSSKTIGEQVTSRNQEHTRCFAAVKELLGDKPLVLDREFSYRALMERLYVEEIPFVIRLNLADQHKQPRLIDADGHPIKLFVRPGKTVIHRQVFYLGVVPVNLIGTWRKGLTNPLWVISSLEPKTALQIFENRMKIEMTFRHCKDLLHLPKLMNKRQDYLEKMIALTLIAFVIALLFGEAQRDVTYGKLDPQQIEKCLLGEIPKSCSQHRKWRLYSGPFVFLLQKPKLPDEILTIIAQAVLALLPLLIYGNVRTFVST